MISNKLEKSGIFFSRFCMVHLVTNKQFSEFGPGERLDCVRKNECEGNRNIHLKLYE